MHPGMAVRAYVSDSLNVPLNAECYAASVLLFTELGQQTRMPDTAAQPMAYAAQRSDVLRLEGVVKRYDGRTVLDNISLTVPSDEYVSLLGPSGSGKTVLLRVIAGFEQPEGGRVLVDGNRIDGLAPHRRGIGFVFQNFALFPHLTVHDNIAYGLAHRAVGRLTDPVALRSRVRDMIALVGLGGMEDRGVHQISGGQRQRVALARTLVTQPRLVLLDEPLGALDANLRERMRGELRAIRAQLGVTFLHVTGSETEALAMGDRVIVLDAGCIAQFDTPDCVYNTPAGPNVAGFLNSYNLFDGTLAGGRFTTSCGTFAAVAPVTRSTRPAYAIRRDLIAIRPVGQMPAPGEASVIGRLLASEYSGPTIAYLFSAPNGQIVEIENHLSHRVPETLVPQEDYQLAWKDRDAVVFG